MTDEELTQQLARALYQRDDAAEFTTWEELPDWNRRMWLADGAALLPIVRRAQAQALREAADDHRRGMGTVAPQVPLMPAGFGPWLRDRADALEAER